ncbi:MAG: Crp/Fnr family transcriptional regulator [Polaromonas sp.]|uniref:Crp/Fnr family transcriptional regulator n=1 Tax=Polaromonas sp. TaxID=1869339 RepID=UPI001818A566|nr:Crp/Fnr family transcriptional regulator [Polaromonas sp.]MBA3592423.1 Crp/Fnr family transcriptional regulator [Polaromonas sp.]
MSLEPAALPHHRFLRGQPWFGTLSDDSKAALLERSLTLAGRKGEVMLAAGAPVQGWYAVLSGLVKLQSTSSEGRVSAFLGVPDGEWFGEGSVLKTEARRYDVIALRETVLLCLPRTEFDKLLADCLPFNHFLVAHLNRRLGQAMTIIEAGRLRSPGQRVALYLSRVFWQGRRRLVLSQEELGHLAGLSRQTVNRALKSMEQRGLVSLEFGRVAMLDEQALAAYATRPSGAPDQPSATAGQDL